MMSIISNALYRSNLLREQGTFTHVHTVTDIHDGNMVKWYILSST